MTVIAELELDLAGTTEKVGVRLFAPVADEGRAPWACRSRNLRRPTPPHHTSTTIWGSIRQPRAESPVAVRAVPIGRMNRVAREKHAVDPAKTQPAPGPGDGYAMASLSSGRGSSRDQMIKGLPATEPARSLLAGPTDRPCRTSAPAPEVYRPPRDCCRSRPGPDGSCRCR